MGGNILKLRDRVRGAIPRVFSPTSFEPTDDANGHVVFAKNLTTQTDSAQALRGQDGFFAIGLRGRLTRDELDAAGRAARCTRWAKTLSPWSNTPRARVAPAHPA